MNDTKDETQATPDLAKDLTFDELVALFEEELLAPETVPSVDRLIELINAVEQKIKFIGLRDAKTSQAVIENRYTRLAAVVSRVAVHPEVIISHNQLSQICRRKQTFAYIFNASGYRNMSHLVSLAGSRVDGKLRLSLQKAAVLLAFMGLEDVTDELMDVCLKQPPNVLLKLMLGWLNQRAIITEQAEKNRTRLLDAGPLIAGVDISDADISLAVNSWMYTSYACSERKHDLKEHLNTVLKNRMARADISPKRPKKTTRKRPVMLIIHERFISAHAMYRCYAPLIQQLDKTFELRALADTESIDDEASQLFTETHKLESPRPSIKQIVELIEGIKPDVIYYPSLGMSHWTVMIANLRLARVQIASLGHPATTRMDTIDFVYTPKMEGDLTKVFSERILVGESGELFEAHPDLMSDLPFLASPSDREVRIAVNSKVMKLSYRLINICKKLAAEATKPVAFSIFPGERGIYYDGLVPAIQSQLPTATVHPYQGYSSFLKEIAKCDLALSAFPFGNTNSTVDTALLGLPTVAHFGPECPAQSDKRVMETAGLPTEGVAQTDEEFFQIALRLIEDEDARKRMTGGLDRESVRANLLGNKRNQEVNNFGEVFTAAYRHYDQIRSSQQRVWTHSDLMALVDERSKK